MWNLYIYEYIFCTVYVDYDWCEAYPSGFDHLPVCMNG